MTSWFRIVGTQCVKDSPVLTKQIQTHITDTALGRRSIANLRPFILIQPLHMSCLNSSLQYAVDTVSATARKPHIPYLMSTWAKHEVRPDDCQLICTRIWLRPRPYQSLYWFIATECTSQTRADYLQEISSYPQHASLGPMCRDPRRN